jgi:hypothetical protein
MANMTIDSATADTTVTGVEMLPASDGGSPKKISIDQIKAFIVQAILDATDASALERSGSKLMVRTSSGSLRRIALDDVLAAAEDAIFGNTAATTLSNAAIIAFKDGSAYKTITYADFVQLLSSSTAINISGLDAASALADANLVLLDQSGNVKATLSTLKAYVLAGLASYLSSLSAGTVTDGSNSTPTTHLLVETSGIAYKISITDLVPFFGNVTGPAETVADEIVQWSNTSRGVKGGLTLTTSVAASGSTSNTKLPTETAVRSALEALKTLLQSAISALSFCKKPANYTGSNVPTLGSDDTLGSGYPVRTTLRDSTLADNASLATEAAIRSAIEAAVSALSTTLSNSTILRAPNGFTVGNVPTFSSATSLGLGYGVRTSIRDANNASNTNLATELAIRLAIDNELGNFLLGPSTVTQGMIPLWDDASTLAAGLVLRDTIRAEGTADDVSVVTEAAIRAVLDAKAGVGHTHYVATTEAAGFMSAADKVKLNSLENDADLDNFSSEIADADKISMTDQSVGSKYRLSFGQIWSWIVGKLAALPLTTFTVGANVTTANATTSAPGLLPKLDGSSSKFLAGDGTWQAPAGSEVFEGDEGSGGSSGLVPAPSAGQAGYVLMGDGSWGEPPIQTGSEHVGIHDKTAASEVLDADELLVYQSGAFKKMTALQLAAFAQSLARYDVLWVPAGAITPNATYGAIAEVLARSASNMISVDSIRFSSQEDTFADFDVVFPDDWDGGSLKIKIHWTPYTSSTAEGQIVRFGLRAKFFDNDAAITGSPGNYSYVDDLVLAYDDEHITSVLTITPNGSYVPGQRVHFWMTRDFDYTDGEAQALATGASVLGVAIQYRRVGGTEAWT